MRIAFRVVILLMVFAGVGWMAARATLSRAVVRQSSYRPETRLAAMTAGLFAGGAAVVIVGIGMAMRGGKPKQNDE
jgi:hypothetical protein